LVVFISAFMAFEPLLKRAKRRLQRHRRRTG
jgi:hypothetical protein